MGGGGGGGGGGEGGVFHGGFSIFFLIYLYYYLVGEYAANLLRVGFIQWVRKCIPWKKKFKSSTGAQLR